MYRPQKLVEQNLALQKETIAAVYAIERDIVRFDERIRHSPCASAVRESLIRGDALGILNIDKIYPSMYTLFRIQTAGKFLSSYEDTEAALRKLLVKEQLPTFDIALETYRYIQTVNWMTNRKNNVHLRTPEDMLDLYRRCVYGPAMQQSSVSFRQMEVPQSEGIQAIAFYEVPKPDQLGPLLEDFCSFISGDILSPIPQASIAQFQFEALKPFDQNLDQMERLIMHYILSKTHLVERIVMPFNLLSGHFKDRFQQLFTAHHSSEQKEGILLYAEDLVLHTTKVAYGLIRLTHSLNKTLLALVDQWKVKLGRVEKGSAVESLLYCFAGTPIMTIAQGSELINKSFSSTSEAFERLEKAGILRPGLPIRRNKTFEAVEAIGIHDAMYQRRATSIEEWVKSAIRDEQESGDA